MSHIAGGALRAILVQVSGLALAFGAQIALARWLGPIQFGIYALVVAWVSFLSVVAGLGLPVTLLRFIPQYEGRAQLDLVRGLVRTSYGTAFAAGIGVCVAALSVIGSMTGLDAGTRIVFLIGLWMVPILAIADIQTGAARAFGRTNLALVPLAVGRPTFVVLGAVSILILADSVTATQAMAATVIAVLGVAAWQGIRLTKSWRTNAKSAYRLKTWGRVAIPLWLLAVFQMVSNRADVLILGGHMSAEDVGVYVAASRTAGLTTNALIAVGILAAPTFASLHAKSDFESLKRATNSATRMAFWPTLPIVLIFAAFGREILALFGPEFERGYVALLILAIGHLANAGVGAVGLLLNVTGHQNDTLRVFALVATVNVALNLILIPIAGLLGAAGATACTTIIWNLWLHRLVKRRLGIRMWIFGARRSVA